MGEQFGSALVREGRVIQINAGNYRHVDMQAEKDADSKRPAPKGKYKRRDMRAKVKE